MNKEPSKSRNQVEIEIEVISYPCRGGASQVVGAVCDDQTAPESSRSFGMGGWFISAAEEEGLWGAVPGTGGIERRSHRRKAS